jgi:urease accessory protein
MLDLSFSSSKEILYLLQLSSPALPVGAYSYSEGIELLVSQEKIINKQQLVAWLNRELSGGNIRIETSVLLRIYQNFQSSNMGAIDYWNQWLSAARETAELREQSWQMGQSLIRLLTDLEPNLVPSIDYISLPHNYALAYAIVAAYWQIQPEVTIVAYLYGWTTNMISAAIKSIPLGQTDGQKLTLELQPLILRVAVEVIAMKDNELGSCSWGMALASMEHEIQYSRLFRS